MLVLSLSQWQMRTSQPWNATRQWVRACMRVTARLSVPTIPRITGRRFLMSSERAVSPLELSELLLQGMEKRALDGSHNIRYLAKHLRKALPKKVATAPGDSSASQYRTLYNMGNCEHILGVGLRELQVRVGTHDYTE